MQKYQNSRAFSIIEVLFALTILSGVFAAIVSLFSGSSTQVTKLKENEERIQVQENALACFRSLWYTSFADNSGNLIANSGSLSFWGSGTLCMTGSYDSPVEIKVRNFLGSGSASETEVWGHYYVDTYLVWTGANFVTINNTISSYGSGGDANTQSLTLYK